MSPYPSAFLLHLLCVYLCVCPRLQTVPGDPELLYMQNCQRSPVGHWLVQPHTLFNSLLPSLSIDHVQSSLSGEVDALKTAFQPCPQPWWLHFRHRPMERHSGWYQTVRSVTVAGVVHARTESEGGQREELAGFGLGLFSEDL